MLPASNYPRLDTLFRQGERLWNEREDLQEAFPEIGSAEYWFWMMWHGAEHYPEVQEALYPIPDSSLTGRVVGENSSALDFHRGGLLDWRRINNCLRAAGFDFKDSRKVLDFGCGCGRILRFFGLYADSCEFFGADVDSGAIAACENHLDFASFSDLQHQPPSSFSAGTFDAIYAFSVFTHLPENRHHAWLEELHRITRPGAILVLTVQGRHVIDLVLSGDRELGEPSTDELRARMPDIEQSGFGFFPYRKIESRNPDINAVFDRWDLEQYGNAFILEPYIRKSWAKLFEIHAIHFAPDEWQDYVVLRRR